MSMFDKVVEHVVASAGAKTLHAVPDINSAERCKVFCIVERKKSFWFWKKPSMIPTFVTLKDLLVNGEDVSAKEKKFTLIKKFEDSPQLTTSGSIEVTGKLAKQIAAQVNVNLDGDDKINLLINLGDIIKCEVSFEDLREAIKGNPVDVTHPLYVSAAKESPKTSLCIVIEELSTKDDGTVKEEGEWKVAVGSGASAGTNNIKVDIKGKCSVDSTFTQSYMIPPSTVLAYSCIEISVDPNGNVSLHDKEDTLDQAEALLQLPENPFESIKNEFQPFITPKAGHPETHKFQTAIKALFAHASESDFRVMHILLYYAYAGVDTSIPVSTLNHLLGVDITLVWKDFMYLLGFSIQEDVTNGSTVIFPGEVDHDLFKACLALIDSILDCHQESWGYLKNISVEHARVIMSIIEKNFWNSDICVNDADVHSMLKHDPSALNFLKKCSFKEGSDGVLTFMGKNSYDLLDVYAVIYFLSSQEKHCCIL